MKKLDSLLREIKDEVYNSLEPFELYKVDVSIGKVSTLIDARINIESWTIHIRVDKNAKSILEKTGRKLGIQEPFKSTIFSVTRHEIGHHKVCPKDINFFEDIIHGISRALSERGYKIEQIKSLSPYLSNLFMDIIVNTFEGLYGKNPDKFKRGRILKYYYTVSSKNDVVFATFIRIQEKLYGLDEIVGLTKMRFSNKTYLLAEEISTKIIDGWFGKNRKIDYIFDPSNWEELAYIFTKHLLYYIPSDELEKQLLNIQLTCPFAIQLAKQQNKSKKQSYGREKENENIWQQLMQIRINKILGGNKAGNSKKTIPYATPKEILKEYLKRVSRKIVFEIYSKNKDTLSQSYTVSYLTKERTDYLKGKILWSKTIFVSKKNEEDVWIYYGDNPYNINIPVSPRYNRRLDDILFVIDVSGSMFEKIYEPKNVPAEIKDLVGTKWELAMRAFIGISEYMLELGSGSVINYSIITFSRLTKFSGWREYFDIDDLIDFVLDNLERDGTYLDVNTLISAVNKQSTVVILTDGFISNETEVYHKLVNLHDSGYNIIFFQIGEDSDLRKKLSEYGISSIHISNPEDLDKIVIKNVIQYYK